MTNNTQSLTNAQVAPPHIGKVHYATRHERLKSTGCSRIQFERRNEGEFRLARSKIIAATIALIAAGHLITRSEMERASGCAKNTVNKHADIWRDATGDIYKQCEQYAHELIQDGHAQETKINPPSFSLSFTKKCTLEQNTQQAWLSKVFATWAHVLDKDLRSYLYPYMRFGFGSCPYRETESKRLQRGRGSFFASLFQHGAQIVGAICNKRPWVPVAKTPIAAAKNWETAGRREHNDQSIAAKNNPNSASRCSILLHTNKDTGEVFPMIDEGRSMIWTPSPTSPKPPGNPFLKKRSENKPPIPAARVETQSYPQQPPEIYTPCPEEIKDQIKELSQKFNMDRITRDAKFARATRNTNLTHLERLNVEQSANEDWFKRNNRLVNSILLNRGTI